MHKVCNLRPHGRLNVLSRVFLDERWGWELWVCSTFAKRRSGCLRLPSGKRWGEKKKEGKPRQKGRKNWERTLKMGLLAKLVTYGNGGANCFIMLMMQRQTMSRNSLVDGVRLGLNVLCWNSCRRKELKVAVCLPIYTCCAEYPPTCTAGTDRQINKTERYSKPASCWLNWNHKCFVVSNWLYKCRNKDCKKLEHSREISVSSIN